MKKIDEIALRVAEKVYDCKFPPACPSSERLIQFAHALLAELSKEAEPVAIADGTFNHNCELGTPLFTHPAPVIASEQKSVAWCDDSVLSGYVGLCCSNASKLYWEQGSSFDREHGERHNNPLFTSPPNTAEIEQRVAEACAKVYLDTYDLTDIADDVRSGKWREYL